MTKRIATILTALLMSTQMSPVKGSAQQPTIAEGAIDVVTQIGTGGILTLRSVPPIAYTAQTKFPDGMAFMQGDQLNIEACWTKEGVPTATVVKVVQDGDPPPDGPSLRVPFGDFGTGEDVLVPLVPVFVYDENVLVYDVTVLDNNGFPIGVPINQAIAAGDLQPGRQVEVSVEPDPSSGDFVATQIFLLPSTGDFPPFSDFFQVVHEIDEVNWTVTFGFDPILIQSDTVIDLGAGVSLGDLQEDTELVVMMENDVPTDSEGRLLPTRVEVKDASKDYFSDPSLFPFFVGFLGTEDVPEGKLLRSYDFYIPSLASNAEILENPTMTFKELEGRFVRANIRHPHGEVVIPVDLVVEFELLDGDPGDVGGFPEVAFGVVEVADVPGGLLSLAPVDVGLEDGVTKYVTELADGTLDESTSLPMPPIELGTPVTAQVCWTREGEATATKVYVGVAPLEDEAGVLRFDFGSYVEAADGTVTGMVSELVAYTIDPTMDPEVLVFSVGVQGDLVEQPFSSVQADALLGERVDVTYVRDAGGLRLVESVFVHPEEVLEESVILEVASLDRSTWTLGLLNSFPVDLPLWSSLTPVPMAGDELELRFDPEGRVVEVRLAPVSADPLPDDPVPDDSFVGEFALYDPDEEVLQLKDPYRPPVASDVRVFNALGQEVTASSEMMDYSDVTGIVEARRIAGPSGLVPPDLVVELELLDGDPGDVGGFPEVAFGVVEVADVPGGLLSLAPVDVGLEDGVTKYVTELADGTLDESTSLPMPPIELGTPVTAQVCWTREGEATATKVYVGVAPLEDEAGVLRFDFGSYVEAADGTVTGMVSELVAYTIDPTMDPEVLVFSVGVQGDLVEQPFSSVQADALLGERVDVTYVRDAGGLRLVESVFVHPEEVLEESVILEVASLDRSTWTLGLLNSFPVDLPLWSSLTPESPRGCRRLHFLRGLESWQTQRGIPQRYASGRYGWYSSTRVSTTPNGRPSTRSRLRSAVLRRHSASGYVGPRSTRAAGTV